jgi:parvulin-like peptidyl-prolyl isomerase
MLKSMPILPEDIVCQIKLSGHFPSVMEAIVNRKIMAEAAAEAGIKIEPAELQQAADQIRLANKLYNPEETWAWLEKHGLSLEEFEEIARTNVLSAKLAQHLFADQVEPFFVAHQLDYHQAAIYEVVLDDPDLAMELFYALGEGEISFPEVAREYIQDVNLRRCGGYLGVFSRQQLKPEISAAVFATTPPAVLKPIVTSNGIHLIFVEEIVEPELNEELRQKILADLLNDWLKQRLADINLNLVKTPVDTISNLS